MTNVSREEQSQAFLNSDAVGDEFFNSIIEKKLELSRDKFKIRLVMLSPATGQNENFISVVYRAKIKVELLETKERKSVDVILKVLLSTMEEFKKFSVFPRERFMYENIIKSFEQIWLDRANKVVKFSPKCIRFETDPYEIIVLDDLKADGYVMLNRKVGLTEVQTKLALSKLAMFHAASAVRYQNDGHIQDYLVRKLSLPKEMFSGDTPFAKSFTAIYEAFIKALRSYGGCDKYADKIARWDKTKFFQCFLDVAEPMKCGLQVLTHGDFWLNNMMFKFKEDNEIEDVSILDFQGCAWAGPSLDLHYFMTSSVHDDVKVEKYDEFIKFYHDELCKYLEELKYDQHIPTLDELYVDLLEKSGLAVQSSFFIMFVTKYDSNEEINMDDFMSSHEKEDKDTFFERIYGNENYKKAIKLWLPFFDERGYIDSLLPDNQQTNGHLNDEN